MNSYRTSFSAKCPVNGALILYWLEISTDRTVLVEELLKFLYGIEQGLHEEIADRIWRQFGGRQVLKAHHHGVDIETTRTSRPASQYLDQTVLGMAGTPGY